MGFSIKRYQGGNGTVTADFLNAEIDRFLGRYAALPHQTDLPLRADFKAEDLHEFLADILLYEVIDDGADFLCRLVGENIKANYGGNQTGKCLSEIIRENPSVAHFRDNFIEVIKTRRPVRRQEVYTDLMGIEKTTVGAIAPLSRDGERVDFCVCL